MENGSEGCQQSETGADNFMDVNEEGTTSPPQQCPSGSGSDAACCDAGPCKKMRRESEEEDGGDEESVKEEKKEKKEKEEVAGCSRQDPEPVMPMIGLSGLYALAKSDNVSNNADVHDFSSNWTPSVGSLAKITFSLNTHGRKTSSPRKNYDGDTQHLSSFGRLLEGGSQLVGGPTAHGTKSVSCFTCESLISNPNRDTSVAMDTQTTCVHGDIVTSATTILPPSLLVNIFQYLSMSDLLCCVSRVCRLWYQVAHDPSLWRHIFLPVTSRVTDKILNWLTSLSDRVLTLDVSDSKHTTFTDDGMIQILKKCHYIRTLKLARYFVFSDDVFESVGMYCHQVRHLNLDGCFSISDPSIEAIGNGCPLLEYLYMSQCNRISDEGMLAVAKGCPRLRQVRIDQCVKVKDVSIKALVAGCPDLEYLHLLACSLTDDGLQQLAKLSRLRMLDISNMTQLSSACLEKIARSCKQLEVLSVSLNRTVDDECIKTIVQSCVHLKCLSCVACNLTDKTLDHIGQYSRTLERVDVAWCGDITDAGVRSISQTCKSLRYLGLMRCGQVTMETVDELIPLFPHIHYSNFVLESRKLLQRAKNDGHHVPLHFL